MFKAKMKKVSIVLIAILALTVVGCSKTDNDGDQTLLEQLDYKIVGIDAGAGIMKASEDAVKDYGLENITVQTSSDAAMTQALGDAIENNEPIVVTAWTPHWKFARYDLKYLEDPKGSYGGAETINTMVRLGLKEDDPNAYKILDQFNWNPEDMESVMLEYSEGMEIEDAAAEWIDDNEDKVNEWIEGAEKVDGKEIKLAYVAWDSAIASHNVVGKVLEDMGYDVTLTQVEAGAMWAAVASGDADGLLSAWLPGTHEQFIADYKDEVEDLGPNLEGAKIGLAVPTYVDIDSIEDLVE